MGRRFLLILGIMLLAPAALPMARAQDDGAPAAPTPTAPASPELPLPTPIELPSAVDRSPTGDQPKSDKRGAGPTVKAGAGIATGRQSAGPVALGRQRSRASLITDQLRRTGAARRRFAEDRTSREAAR